MLTSAPPSRWITKSAAANVRVQVTPRPSDEVAVAIMGALQSVAVEPDAAPATRTSPWQRAALIEAVGDGAEWVAGA